MCLVNCNIEVEENKEKKEKKDLTYEERLKIEDMLRSRTQYTMKEIANAIKRDKSIVSREIKRNAYLKWNEKMAKYVRVYSAARAQGDYEARKKKAGRKSAIDEDRALKQFVEDKILKEKWSPEEVAGYIKKHNIKFKIQPTFQTIYYWIEKKKEFGHWELDCVEGKKGSKKTYMTLLERITKKYIVIEMKEHTNKCVQEAMDKLEERYGKYFKEIFKSMTTDNGYEFLNYDNIEISKLDEKTRRTIIYYADPYSSWQKGMNENCNGILRRFIPKGTNLNKISSKKLERIVNKINEKPRKVLGFVSANELFEEEIKKIVA